MSCTLKWKSKDFPSTTDICTNKDVAEIKSYYPRFAHVKESCKACFRKVIKLHTYENNLEPVFGKPFERYFWVLKIVYYDKVKAFFKRKALEANANFNVFESQCPKIRILSKALKAKLSKCPQWSRQSVDASCLLDHSLWQHLVLCRLSGRERKGMHMHTKLEARVLWRNIVSQVCD